MPAISAFIPFWRGFSFFLMLLRPFAVFILQIAGFSGFQIPITLNILAQQLDFQLMGMNFTALAQAELLALLDMFEYV